MRYKDVKHKIEKAGGNIDVFMKWMYGQTVGTYEDGKTDYYEYDVQRFIDYKCDPRREPWYEWD